jgi:hypothetical protein
MNELAWCSCIIDGSSEPTEAHDAEHDGQNDETAELNGFTTDSVDSSDSDPVTGDGTSTDQDQVANGDSVEDLVDARSVSVTNCL